MILYIIGALVVGTRIGWVARNMSIVRHCKMETVMCIEGDLYAVKRVSKESPKKKD